MLAALAALVVLLPAAADSYPVNEATVALAVAVLAADTGLAAVAVAAVEAAVGAVAGVAGLAADLERHLDDYPTFAFQTLQFQ